MKKLYTQQEVLLIMNNTFSTREWAQRNDGGDPKPFDAREQITAGCWNGLIRDLLPEVFIRSEDNKDLTLWQIREGDSFVELELGDIPAEIETDMSINPYIFLPTLIAN